MPAYKDPKTGKWYCQFYFKDWQGNRKHKVKRGFERKKDAEQWEREFLTTKQSEQMTVSALFAKYKEHMQAKIKLGTLRESSYNSIITNLERHLITFLGSRKIDDICSADIDKWLSSINSKYKNKTLAPGTKNLIKSQTSSLFKFAQKNYGLTSNPVTLATAIKSDQNGYKNPRADLWTLSQYKLFYYSLRKDIHRIIFNIMIFAGLRIGEILALTMNDVTQYQIRVIKSRSGYNNRIKSGPTKTTASERFVQIPRFLYWQIKDYADKLYNYAPDDLLFTINSGPIRQLLNRKAQVLGLPRISPHILRHSYASLLLAETKDVMVVSKQIGHANPQITLSTYSHMIPGKDRESIDALERIIAIDTGMSNKKLEGATIDIPSNDSQNNDF